MYHSINIESTERSERFNTYDAFGGNLIPGSRPLVKTPETKTSYVDVPGANGSLDYTEALNGLLYKNRKGSWEFYVNNGYQVDEGTWNIMYSSIMGSIHGKYFDHIWLEDDTREEDGKPSYYYKGRIFVNEWKSDPQFSKVVLDYELEPYKYPEPMEGHEVEDWLWDDLFFGDSVDPIQYGKFYVSESKDRTIVGSPHGEVTVFADTAMTMTILYNGEIINIPAHESTTFNLSATGLDRVRFKGIGNVELSYDGGPIL